MSLFKGFTLGCLETAGVDLDRQFVFVFLIVDVGIGVELRGAFHKSLKMRYCVYNLKFNTYYSFFSFM